MGGEVRTVPNWPTANEEIDRILQNANGNIIIGRTDVESKRVELSFVHTTIRPETRGGPVVLSAEKLSTGGLIRINKLSEEPAAPKPTN